MLDFFRRKKRDQDFSPRQQLDRLTELSPPSTLVTLVGGKEPEELGKAFFLRRDKKIFSDGDSLYLTTPENLKDQSVNGKTVSLQFFHRRIPHRMECRVAGRYRLLPEVVETLDFHAQAAYKLSPVGVLRKEDKRQYLRYTLKNYGDTRIPLTTHIVFDLYMKPTNKQFPADGAPPTLINDLTPTSHKEQESHGSSFATRDAINEFRDLMLRKPPHERYVHISKVKRDDSGGMVRRPDEELLLGEINILGLEMESLRDVLYMKKSTKAGIKKGQDNPYNLHPGEKILAFFSFDDKYYKMLCEVMEARTQNEVVRPLEFMREEEGLQVELVDYSIGGCLIESSPELLRFILGDSCPSNVEEETEFSGRYWQEAFEELQTRMLHLTLYPQLQFPDAVKQFQPELPFRFSIVGQIVRTHLHQMKERTFLQHGVQFAYEPQGIPLEDDEQVNWRYSRYIRDNLHLREAHSHLSQLYGYLENQSLSSGVDRRASRKPPPQ